MAMDSYLVRYSDSFTVTGRRKITRVSPIMYFSPQKDEGMARKTTIPSENYIYGPDSSSLLGR